MRRAGPLKALYRRDLKRARPEGLDGLEGLAIAYMSSLYTFLKYAKARNMGSWGGL